jgi:hypothetical protein
MVDEEIVSVDVVSGMIEAEILRGLLEAAGVAVWLSHESAGSAYGLSVGPMGEVEIFVPRRDETTARQVVSAYHAGQGDDEQISG